MNQDTTTEDTLRELAPQVLGALVRRYGNFADAEDAVQEALVAAATSWPDEGVPENPHGWLLRVASRRMTDHFRADEARRRREDAFAALPATAPASGQDDTLILMFMCCHPSLTPGAAIPLCLRAVGGLTTREIASAFLVPEATMAQRISRAKAKVADAEFSLPPPDERDERLAAVLHVLYLMYNEGYTVSSGTELARLDLSSEAIRLARAVAASLDEPETVGLLALMLLNDARRAARTGPRGELIPLAEQDRSLWDRPQIVEGVRMLTAALKQGRMGEYQAQASIAAVHDQANRYEDTNWRAIDELYAFLERTTSNPMVTLNRAAAIAMLDGPLVALASLQGLDETLPDYHRLHAMRGHLLEMAGDTKEAIAEFEAAAARTTNARERDYLTLKVAGLR